MSGADEDDPLRQARAYNRSIYLMLGMPYLLLGLGGTLLYRRYRNYSNPPPQDPTP